MVLDATATVKVDSSLSKASPCMPETKRALEDGQKAEPGAKLADLCDEDKAKVARLIDQVLLAFREIHRLRDLLEDERKVHETMESKLREQNQEVAAEVSQLRQKLTSMQNLLTPLQLHKAECSNVGEVPTVQPRVSDQLLTPGEMESVPCQNAASGMGDEEDDRWRSKFQNLDSQVSTRPRGKENQNPRLSGTGTEVESGQVLEQELQKRRPLPRPLPDLVVNILQTNKKVMSSAPDDKGITADSTTSLDRPTPAKAQESSSSDGEPGIPLAPAAVSYLIGLRGRQREVTNCRDIACHKYSGESDESFRSSKRKMRFDPTAGEEGKFYYASDLENTGCDNIQRLAILQAEDDSKVQSQELSIEYTCTRCCKPLTRKSVERKCVSRKHSFDGVASPDDGTILVNREKKVAPEWTPGSRYKKISTLAYVTDQEYESASSTKTIGVRNNSGRLISSSNLCSRHVHICVKCSSPFVGRLPRHRMKERNEKERRPRCATDESSPIHSIPTNSLLYTRSRNPAECTRCSCLSGKLNRKSNANWKTAETETDDYSSEEDMTRFHPKVPSEKKNLVKGGEDIHQVYTRGTEALGRSEGSGQLTTGALLNKKMSELRVTAHDTSGEDSRLSPESNASMGRSSPVRSRACKVHGRRAGERHDGGEENAALEDEADERSEPKTAVFQVNHEPVETLSQSETQYSESLRCSSLVDEKILKPTIYCIRAREENCCRASEDGRLELGSAPASQCPPQAELHVKLDLKKAGETPITLPNLQCKVPRPKIPIGKSIHKVIDDEQAEQAHMEVESRSAHVEDLLGRFIRSNAECAELIKCFQSKVIANPLGGPISKQITETKGKPNQSEEPRDNNTHHQIGKTTLEPTKCTGCLAILKTEVIGSVASSDGSEVKDTEVLCGKCSTSKNPQLVSSATHLGGKNPRTSTNIHLNDGSKLDGMYSESLATNCLPRGHDHKTTTAAAQVEKTEDWRIGLFDISLFHLVNDLEVDETEYWNQINTKAIEENTDIRKYDTRRKRMVLERGRASTVSRWGHPSRHTNAKHFR